MTGITEDMVERGARAVAGTIFRSEFEGSHNKHVDLARAVLSAALAGCTETPEPPERGEVADRMARGRQWLAHHGNAYLPTWDDLTPVEQEQAVQEARYWIQAAVNTGVKIVPPGWTVVALPEPDGTSLEGDPIWSAHVDYEATIFATVEHGHPVVLGPFSDGPWHPDSAEMFGLRLLAAAREARRLAGEQHGE